jgi:hypothetical protein
LGSLTGKNKGDVFAHKMKRRTGGADDDGPLG